MDEKKLAYDILCALCESSLADELSLYRNYIQDDLKLTSEQMDTYYNLPKLVSLLQPVKPQLKFYKGQVINQPESGWTKVFNFIQDRKLDVIEEEPKEVCRDCKEECETAKECEDCKEVCEMAKECETTKELEKQSESFETDEKFLLLKKYFQEHGKEPVKNEKYEGQRIFRIYKEFHKNEDAMKVLNGLRFIVVGPSISDVNSGMVETPDVSDIEN